MLRTRIILFVALQLFALLSHANISVSCLDVFHRSPDGGASSSQSAALYVDEGNYIAFANRFRDSDAIPDGTRFSSLDVLNLVFTTWAEQFGHDSVFRWKQIGPYNVEVALPFHVASDRNLKDGRFEIGYKQNFESPAVMDGLHEPRTAIQLSNEDVVEIGWQGRWFSGFDSQSLSLLFGAFSKESIFRRFAQSGAEIVHDSDILEREIVGKDPILMWSNDGTVTFFSESRRAVMVKSLERHLAGRKLIVYRSQSRVQGLLLELVRYLGSPRAEEIRRDILRAKAFEIEEDFGNKSYLSFLKERELQKLATFEAVLDPVAFAEKLLKESKAPYLFTTPSKDHLQYFAPSEGRVHAYEVDLSLLPKEYKNRIYIAPDGAGKPYSIEIDFPTLSVDDIRALCRGLRRI